MTSTPVIVTLVFLDPRAEAMARAWLPARWDVVYRTPTLSLSHGSPSGVVITDSPDILFDMTRRRGPAAAGILLAGGSLELQAYPVGGGEVSKSFLSPDWAASCCRRHFTRTLYA